MTFSGSSYNLEKLVSRIYTLLEPTSSKITWNKKIQDPDTGQLRQVDCTIERANEVIHIECRDHQSPQNVQWIEELIGRKSSLGASGVIGVSASGFTKPAIEKALKHGIFLRELSELTETEIARWGDTAKITVELVEIFHFNFSPILENSLIQKISPNPTIEVKKSTIDPFYLIIQEILHSSDVKFYHDRNTNISCELKLPETKVDGILVENCMVEFSGRAKVEKSNVLGVWNYKGVEPIQNPEVFVSQYSSVAKEIIHNRKDVAMLLDLSTIYIPKNCFMKSWTVDFGSIVNAKIVSIGNPNIENLKLTTTQSLIFRA